MELLEEFAKYKMNIQGIKQVSINIGISATNDISIAPYFCKSSIFTSKYSEKI